MEVFPEQGYRARIDPRTGRLPRDLQWRVELRSGLEPLRYTLGGLLGAPVVDPVRGRVYVPDRGLRRVWEIDPSTHLLRLVAE
jgi:hypothetical protein